MSSTDAPPAEAKKDSAEATAAAAEALQIREASKAWMFKNRKKKVAFQFNDVPIDECEPWALGMALKELKDNDVTLASVECAELHESIRKVLCDDGLRGQSAVPEPMCLCVCVCVCVRRKRALACYL